LGGMNWKEINL